tara:strand:+ start:1230 stop:1400 length:171 start_codon:yes stop_codon:yes gene_type:complete
MSQFLGHIGFLEVFSVGIVALLGWALIPKETKKEVLFFWILITQCLLLLCIRIGLS